MKRIIVKNVHKTFGLRIKSKTTVLEKVTTAFSDIGSKRTLTVLNGVSFNIGKGELVGIIGVNGSGKSTLLRIIAGIIKPDKGYVKVRGKIVSFLNFYGDLKERMTMKENIYCSCSVLGLKNSEIKKQFPSMVKFTELERFLDTKLFQFSEGMKARVAFSVAIHSKPDIFLIDEVFAVGDTKFRAKCLKSLKTLMKQGTSIIVVSHEIESMQSQFSRIIWLNKGQIMMDSRGKKVIKAYLNYIKGDSKIKKKKTKKLEDKKTEILKKEANKDIIKTEVRELDEKLLERLKNRSFDLHYFLKRKIFYAHENFDKILGEVEKGNRFYLCAGLAPIRPLHLQYLITWNFIKWLQDKFNANLLLQISDEEYLFNNKPLDKNWIRDTILDFIAIGFDPKKTKIFINSQHVHHLYKYASMAAKKLTVSTVKSNFNLEDSENVGMMFYRAVESVQTFLPSLIEGKRTNVLFPCPINNEVELRLMREVAKSMNYPTPATIFCRFLPPLSKTDTSNANATIWTTDDPETVKKKINKSTFSRGRKISKRRRKTGRNLNDVCYQWLTFFEEDEKKLNQIREKYTNGNVSSQHIKKILIDKLNAFLKNHRQKREKAKNQLDKFILKD